MTSEKKYDYDVIVIGGGSGGLAFAKESKKINSQLRIAVFDYVKQSAMGTQWKLGGTCVNVGCIPKKLMHNSGQIIDSLKRASVYGIDTTAQFHWKKMIESIHNYILSLNWTYKKQLNSVGIDYYNRYATFLNKHEIEYYDRGSKRLTSKYFVIATGGRPNYGNFPGSDLCLTSDDLFWFKNHPGNKILVVGGGYIALECASFLNEFGIEVDVMFRSSLLKHFDEQCVQQIAEIMERKHIKFIKDLPKNFEKHNGKIHVTTVGGSNDGIYDNVVLAIGRNPCTKNFGLENIGVKLNYLNNDKIIVNVFDSTTVNNIYAIGDVATVIEDHFFPNGKKVYLPKNKKIGVVVGSEMEATKNGIYKVKLENGSFVDIGYEDITTETTDRPELTPVAIKVGVMLAQRLFNGSNETYPINSSDHKGCLASDRKGCLASESWIPTTVFTSPEYAFAGMSTEEAEKQYGNDNIDIWWSRYGPIENLILHSEFKKTRSSMFTGKNLWSRKYAQLNKLYWDEICYDINDYSNVQYNGMPYTISKINKKDLVYTITNNTKDIKNVSLLELSPFGQTDNYEYQRHIKSDHLCKIITEKKTGNVVGIHFVGKNAGEIIQGFALACSIGITKTHFDKMTSIHPIAAEEFLVLDVSRSSYKNFLKREGCGGGSC